MTGTGKILREQAGKRHRSRSSPPSATRRLTGTVEVAKADAKRIKKLLGR